MLVLQDVIPDVVVGLTSFLVGVLIFVSALMFTALAAVEQKLLPSFTQTMKVDIARGALPTTASVGLGKLDSMGAGVLSRKGRGRERSRAKGRSKGYRSTRS